MLALNEMFVMQHTVYYIQMPMTSLFQKQVPLNIVMAFLYMQTSVHKKVYILKQTCF